MTTKSLEITKEIALELCEKVRKANRKKKIGIGKIQCYFCWNYARKEDENGDPLNICCLGSGCSQVNKLFKETHH